MITAKFLFIASLVVGALAIVLMVLTTIIGQPVLFSINTAILAISIVCALLNYRTPEGM